MLIGFIATLNRCKKLRTPIFLGGVVLLFMIGASVFNYRTNINGYVKWLSPDETANYIFSKLLAQTGRLSLEERYNLKVDDIIQPRSFRSEFGTLKPMSFLGVVILYGSIAKIAGVSAIPYMTPILAGIGLIFFYLLVRETFGRQNAQLSVLLAASFPVYTYYSSRSMFHNVPFLVFFIMCLYFLIKMNRDYEKFFLFKKIPLPPLVKGAIYSCMAGLSLGAAVASRTSELLWIAPLLAVLWLFNIRQTSYRFLLVAIFAIMAYFPVTVQNKILYGGALSSGYPQMTQSIATLAESSKDIVKSSIVGKFEAQIETWSKVKDAIFSFGFNPYQSLRYLYYYLVVMFKWLSVLSMLGFIFFVSKIKGWRKWQVVYLTGLAIVSIILVFYYGSWQFNDNPNPKSFTIGNSYTRYWLPIYFGMIPLASLAIIKVSNLLLWVRQDDSVRARLAKVFQVIVVLMIAGYSIHFVMYGSEEGLVPSARKKIAMINEAGEVLPLTENNSVIITRYHDKLFFPERKVVVGLFDDRNMNERYAVIARDLPVYYYNFTFPKDTLEYLNNRRLVQYGYHLEPLKDVDQFTLYKIVLN